jgi:hypothetical protein
MTTLERLSDYPRISRLEYFIRVPDTVELHSSLRENGTIGRFEYEFVWHQAIFVPSYRFASEGEARHELDPLLDAWTLNALVQLGLSISFIFTKSEVAAGPIAADKNSRTRRAQPMPPSSFRLVHELKQYPSLPTRCNIDECTRDLAAHYQEALNAHRTLLMHAYAMVTRVEFQHGSMQMAARRLAIHLDVLKWVKQMATERTIEGYARKYARKAVQPEPLQVDELETLRRMISELLNRSLSLASGADPGKAVSFPPGGSIAKRIDRDRRRRKKNLLTSQPKSAK